MAPSPDQSIPTAAGTPVIWDVGVRVFHWALVADVLGLWLSARADNFDLHFTLGYLALGLLVFRLIWGVIGSDTARFTQFIRGPGAVLAHVRHLVQPGPLPSHRGHNAAGGWAVVALLLAVGTQVATGLCAVDADGINEGPLAARVGDSAAKIARRLHHGNFSLLEAVVLLHVGAIALYLLLKRENLLYPMIFGRAVPAARQRVVLSPAGGALSGARLLLRLSAAMVAAGGTVLALLWLA